MTSVVPAAGTVPWRHHRGELQVALVHRPRYDDWSWAKGKLEPAEEPSVAAVRETLEETGLRVRLGVPLPRATYPILGPGGTSATKRVDYWSAQVTGGSGLLENEIDEVRWVDVPAANRLLDYARDREQLQALVRLERGGQLDTWPLAVIRHASSEPRSRWKGDDRERPLDAAGHARAAAIAPILAAYGVADVVTSPSVRCLQTISPYAAGLGLTPRTKDSLSEEGHVEHPRRGPAQVDKLVGRGAPAAICSHGPVLGPLLERLARHVDPHDPNAKHLTKVLAKAGDTMDKGEVLVAHLASDRIVAIERLHP